MLYKAYWLSSTGWQSLDISIKNCGVDFLTKMSYICNSRVSYLCLTSKLKKMIKKRKLEDKILVRVALKKGDVFVREDFADLGGYDQVGRAIRNLVRRGALIKIGYGLYARTKVSPLDGAVIPAKIVSDLAKEALQKLGVKYFPSTLEQDYNAGQTTQVPTGRLIAVSGRITRKIGYNGANIFYERRA